jgi:hypothetical protein
MGCGVEDPPNANKLKKKKTFVKYNHNANGFYVLDTPVKICLKKDKLSGMIKIITVSLDMLFRRLFNASNP